MSNNKIVGTVAELVSMGLKVNGVEINQANFSMLSRIGFAREVGQADKKGRGKAATRWEVEREAELHLTSIVSADMSTGSVAVA